MYGKSSTCCSIPGPTPYPVRRVLRLTILRGDLFRKKLSSLFSPLSNYFLLLIEFMTWDSSCLCENDEHFTYLNLKSKLSERGNNVKLKLAGGIQMWQI